MVLVLKEPTDVKKIKDQLANRKEKKKFDAKKFCGALKSDEDGLMIQKKLRNEWE